MTRSAWRLRGSNALVTGQTRRIGRAIVSELRELGAHVTRRHPDQHLCAMIT